MFYSLKNAALATVIAVAMYPHAVLALSSDDDPMPPSASEAREFLKTTDAAIRENWVEAARAQWLASNFITSDTQQLAADAGKKSALLAARLAREAAQFNDVDLSPAERRQLDELRRQTLPAPLDEIKAARLAAIAQSLEAQYGAGQYCPSNGECKDLQVLTKTMASSRDYHELLDAWQGWRTVSPAMRDDYLEMIGIATEGAQSLGYANLADAWRSGYDMDPDAFADELDRLWGQVQPLYEELHCHVRAGLAEYYGKDLVDTDGPIPAHLLGNMWAQTWDNVQDIVEMPAGDPGYDLREILVERDYDELELVRIGEKFFSSLGFAPMPDTFWDRSLFVQPRDRQVVCHASAWTLDTKDDLRIKMCIDRHSAEDFTTIHHELGHVYYDREYNHLPILLQGGAHDGFHEAVGDVLSLSITPAYLKQIGFIRREPPAAADLNLLMRLALEKIAFLPFGLMIDRWRWGVFSGDIPQDSVNEGWWSLREKYQGVKAPLQRTEEHFDPGAKYHIPGNTPYTRYFLSFILQFQFHRALCETAGHKGPLNRCTIYGSEKAGKQLRDVLGKGNSQPWQKTLQEGIGEDRMDASAILDYFAPLQRWLKQQNRGRACGWNGSSAQASLVEKH